MKLWSGSKTSLYALIVLGALAVYMVYSQFFSGPTYKPVTPQSARIEVPSDGAPPSTPAPDKNSGPNISQAKGRVGRGSSSKSKNGEFHPVVLAKKVEDRPDVSTLDPTIRFDLLDRIMKIPQAGATRDLFQISKTPPVTQVAMLNRPETIVHPYVNIGPRLPQPPTPIPTPTPLPPLVVPFKFYGTSAVHPDGKRTAYFIIPGATPDTDEIFMADEGGVVKSRFRIVTIMADRVVVEDVNDKRRQPLIMEKENTQ
jgi:hypothetical protein